MTESAQPVDAGTAPIPETEFVHKPAGTGEISIMDAARSWADARYKREAEAERQASGAEPARAEPATPAATESAQAETAPAEEPTSGETNQEAEPEETLPPIEPPRFWKSEEKERFKSLPRETQEYIAEREQARDAEIRRTQNEAAEARKAHEARAAEAERVKQQYEAQLPALMQALDEANAGAFGDIKTVEDVTKLASEDPFRYLQWQAHQSKMAAVKAELDAANRRQFEERNSKWADYVQKENAKAAELIPELADKEKGPALMSRASERLAALGFGQDELRKLASGEEKISIFDHRLQQLIFSDLKLQDVQKARSTVVAKPLPPAQRPGTAKAPSGKAAEIQALEKRLQSSSGMEAIRLGAELTRLRRAS